VSNIDVNVDGFADFSYMTATNMVWYTSNGANPPSFSQNGYLNTNYPSAVATPVPAASALGLLRSSSAYAWAVPNSVGTTIYIFQHASSTYSTVATGQSVAYSYGACNADLNGDGFHDCVFVSAASYKVTFLMTAGNYMATVTPTVTTYTDTSTFSGFLLAANTTAGRTPKLFVGNALGTIMEWKLGSGTNATTLLNPLKSTYQQYTSLSNFAMIYEYLPAYDMLMMNVLSYGSYLMIGFVFG
jgi:hypothetical protein